MKLLRCEEPGKFSFDDVQDPVRKSGEALVRVRRVGICGTDLHAFRGQQPFFSYPRALGHELAAEIVEIEENDTELRTGDAVVINPYITCSECRPCRIGRTNCCTTMKVLGVHVDGGMSELLSLPFSLLLPANGLELDQMATVECLGIGAHAVRRSGLTQGDLAIVVGAGPIGMGIMQFARLAGADVVVIDKDESRLSYSVDTLGATHGVAAGEGAKRRVEDITSGDLGAFVFDATGSWASMQASFDLVGSAGTYVLVSLVQGEIAFHDPEFHRKEMTLLSSRNATADDLAQVIDALRNGSLATETFITHRASLADVPSVFPSWLEPETGVIKAMVEL